MAGVQLEEILKMAHRAERDGQPAIAEELFVMAGKMDRAHGSDYFDVDEKRNVAYARGLERAKKLETPSRVVSADEDPTWPPYWPHMRAPFPWFGGKSRAAHLIWERIGDVCNYVEPFAGSLATLLKRPHSPRVETVNDIDCMLANFWRSLQADPGGVAEWADAPINEADLHSKHLFLVNRVEFREKMKTDPDYFDVQVAGWWVWGLSCWIAGGWCDAAATPTKNPAQPIPHLSGVGQGIHRSSVNTTQQIPRLFAKGHGVNRKTLVDGPNGAVHNKMPSIAIMGVHRKMPNVGGGQLGVHRKISIISGGGRGIHRDGVVEANHGLVEYFSCLADRLRRVRVCCGNWDRILGPSATTKFGTTGVVLDPPYTDVNDRCSAVYAHDDMKLAHEVRKWAIENGNNPQLRIALCGYEGEHNLPDGWTMVEWKAAGGYGGQRKDGTTNENRAKERIWFSPHCLKPSRGRQATFMDDFPDASEYVHHE